MIESVPSMSTPPVRQTLRTFKWLSNTSGNQVRGYRLVDGAAADGRTFAKANGIGELLAYLATSGNDDYAHPFWLPKFALHHFLSMSSDPAKADIFRAG